MKKILFLNTTKLAVLSAALLLAVFCTIGMSFTPAEEGENIGNPNDSTYVTGPRRSHWITTSSCLGQTNITYNNETDYARVEAVVKIYGENNLEISSPNIGQVTLENISTSAETGTVDGSLLSGDETNTAYINWNCGIGDDKNHGADLKAAHKLKVRFTAKCIHEGYNFVGWYKAEGMSDSDFKEGAASFSEVICIGGGNEPVAGYGNYANSKQQTYTTTNRYTVTYYACFRPKTKVTITLKEAENGTYTYTDGSSSGTISNNNKEGSITTSKQITLTATPASDDYKFFGWYEIKDGKETYFSYNASTEKTFKTDATISAKFIPEDWATYIVRNQPEQYYDFQAVANAADASTDKVFLPLINGVVPAGNYTIPSGVTLLIPYEATYKNSTNEPEVTSGTTKPTKYRQLTLASGCVIDVEGAVCVNAKMTDNQSTNGATWGESGMINMQEGSTITLNSGANLYCWGVIYGKGEITANSGATVYESFQVNDYPGGTFLSLNLTNYNRYKVFPVRIYCFPNIQSKLHLHHGATEKVATAFATDGVGLQKDVAFISTDNGLFITKSGSVITKWYDKDNDLQMYQAKGSIELKSVELKVASIYSVNSANFILPITHNMHIELLPQTNNISSTVTLTNDIAIHPGAKILVNKNVTVKIAENKALYVYDLDQWENNYTFVKGENKSVVYNRSKTISYDKTKGALTDAIFEVAGTIEINGALYTTSSGADIKGVDGGKVIWRNKAPENKTINQCVQSGQYSGEWPEISVTSAQLHNDETRHSAPDNYTQTSGAEAGDEFIYSEYYGKWLKNPKVITWDATTNGGTCETSQTVLPPGETVPELPEATKIGYTFNGWFTAASDGKQITTDTIVKDNVTYYAQWTLNIEGTPLDIVDADNTNQTLTINATSFALSGWPYTINGTEYGKNDKAGKEKYCQPDRTLVIPYGDKDPNEEIVIEVKDKEGTVVSCHMYKVPFVYTSNATLSGTDENSIVFVKSDTLTVGDASAKEIYVAPGAALKVKENSILDVKKLVLRTTPFEAAILTNKGSIKGQVYYSRIARDTDFHLFAIPAGSNTADVVLSDGTSAAVDSTVAPYGNAWQLREYNTARRAELGADGANWDNIGWDSIVVNGDTRDTTYSNVAIEASKGYELRSGSKYYREYLFPVTLPTTATSVQVTDTTSEAGAAAGAADAGWNIICSPYTYIYTAVYNDPARGIKVSWQKQELDGSYSYIQEQPTQIKPAVPFAYQTKEDGSLYFSADSLFFKAPRKQSAAEALTETEWIHLDIFDAYGEGDETSLFVHPTRFEQTYKTGIDVAKQSLTAPRPIIYSTHAYGDMAFAGVADSLLENGIDIAVYSPAAQQLTFSLRENKFLHRLEYLWLADNETGERTDLLMDDYTCRANAGTAKGRFVLNGRFKAPQISTGIGNTQTDYNIYAIGNNIAISGVEQGTPIYVFDAVGHMIYTTSATSDEVIVPAPCAGVYMLTIGGQTAKLVVNQ